MENQKWQLKSPRLLLAFVLWSSGLTFAQSALSHQSSSAILPKASDGAPTLQSTGNSSLPSNFDTNPICTNLNPGTRGRPMPRSSDCGSAIFQIPDSLNETVFTYGVDQDWGHLPKRFVFEKCEIRIYFATGIETATYTWAQIRWNVGIMASACIETHVGNDPRTGGLAVMGPTSAILAKIAKTLASDGTEDYDEDDGLGGQRNLTSRT